MQGFIGRRSVFWSSLFSGTGLLALVLLYASQVFTLFRQFLVSLFIGVFLGIAVVLLERNWFIKKQTSKYKPSKLPFWTVFIISLLNVLNTAFIKSELFAISLLSVCGMYVITLAVIFRVYENKTKQKSITWVGLSGE